MGSQTIQAKLWGQRPEDWAKIQEQTGDAGYNYVFDFLQTINRLKLLDVGCGSGLFSDMANGKGADVIGIDASDKLIDQAKLRNANITFLTGEMEELPFEDDLFDLVCGFNSFQYAASTKNALMQAKRVLKPGGKLVAMIWGNKEDCEAASFLKAAGSLMPPPPPGAPGPFALSENRLLEYILEEIGFTIIDNNDIPSVWDYPDLETALKGLISAGPVARAIEFSGYDKVYDTIAHSAKPFIQSDGHVVYKNKFRIVIAEK